MCRTAIYVLDGPDIAVSYSRKADLRNKNSVHLNEAGNLRNHDLALNIAASTSQAPAPGCADLPPFDKALRTRALCLYGLALSYILSTALIISGAHLYYFSKCVKIFTGNRDVEDYTRPTWGRSCSVDLDRDVELEGVGEAINKLYPVFFVGKISDASKEIISFVFNLIVTVVTECLGYIHCTALRWALYHEDRLHHNSNLRLFSSSNLSWPNKWYTNAAWILLLTTAYSCASQVMLNDTIGANFTRDFITQFGFNSLAVVLLGVCLLLLSLLSTWTFFPTYNRKIVSWSSDPVNTALALQHIRNDRVNRDSIGIPRVRQHSAQGMNRPVRFILVFLWLLVPVVFAVGTIAWYMNKQQDSTFLNSSEWNGASLWLAPYKYSIDLSDDLSPQSAANIFFVAAIQVLYTIALHSAEQLANLARDEAAWRSAGDWKKGAQVGRSSTKAAMTAWPTVFLWALKSLSHWMFGLALVVGMGQRISLHPLPLFALAAMAVVLAVFATFLAYKKPKGPQPAAYGDLRRLAELVDDWGKGAGSKLYWGEKSKDDEPHEVGQLGTSSTPGDLKSVKMDGRLYRGVVDATAVPSGRREDI